MLDGKKGVAQKIVYGAFDIVAEKTGKDPLAFEEAMENVCLYWKLKHAEWWCNLSGTEVRPERRQTLGLRWITILKTQKRKDNEGKTSC